MLILWRNYRRGRQGIRRCWKKEISLVDIYQRIQWPYEAAQFIATPSNGPADLLG
jgi:hypothetical protein